MENLLVNVEKFVFVTNFVILGIEEVVPIILGRPFLYTEGVLIDLRQGKIIWRLDDEEEVLNPKINSSSSPTSNFVKPTNKMKTMVVKPHPSVGKEDPPRKKVFPKGPGWSKRKRDGYRVDGYTEGLMQKRKITLPKGG